MSSVERTVSRGRGARGPLAWGVAALLLVMGAAGAADAQAPGEAMPLVMGGAPIIPYSNAIVAAGKGFFTDAGLTVQRKMIFSTDVSRSALASGDIEVSAMPTDALVLGHLAGFDWQILFQADMYKAETPDAAVVARTDIPFKSAKDLEGKNVAVTLGTIAETAFRAWMSHNGADPGKVHIVEIPFPQMVTALESKSIDAAHMVEPGMAQAIDRKLGRIVGNDLDMVANRYVVSAYVARASWIKANPEKAKRFVQAMARATKYIIDDPNGALPVIAKETKLDETLVKKFFPEYYGAATEVAPAEIQSVIDFMAREKFSSKSFDYHEIVSEYVPMKR